MGNFDRQGKLQEASGWSRIYLVSGPRVFCHVLFIEKREFDGISTSVFLSNR